MSKPAFFSTPFRYMRWASHERPAIFYSIVMGSLGPVALVTLPPIRRYFGDVDPPLIPMSYPSTSFSFFLAHNCVFALARWHCSVFRVSLPFSHPETLYALSWRNMQPPKLNGQTNTELKPQSLLGPGKSLKDTTMNSQNLNCSLNPGKEMLDRKLPSPPPLVRSDIRPESDSQTR